MPRYSSHYDENSSAFSEDSSISSGSGLASTFSGSASTWSLPRSRSGNNNRRATEGPRRSGSSFRVSMRPKGHRNQQHQRGGGDFGLDDDRLGDRSRRYACALSVLALLGAAFHVFKTNSELGGYSAGIFNGLVSTEDMVAQGEMAGISKEESMLLSLPTVMPGSNEDVSANFRGSLSEEQQALVDELSKEAATSLRGNSLEIVDEEDRLSPKSDSNLDATNFSEPARLDWSPSLKSRSDKENQTTVAYVLPVFTCYPLSGQGPNQHGFSDPSSDREFMDAALMLQASVHKNSVRNPISQSSYDYEMVALLHRGVESCAGGANRTEILERIGYRTEVVREPIHAANIQNAYLQVHAPRNNGGRSGMREMIRLYAFKLAEYRLTVLVDFTTFLLHPADAIYDALLNGPRGHEWAESHPSHVVRDTFYPNGTISSALSLPTELDIMFTRDYSSMSPNGWTTGISLAFVPIRPSASLFKKLVNTYQNTNYEEKHGWDSKGYAHYAGSMQTKGLITYYFSEIEPDRKLELHRCIYNNLADIPFIAGKNGASDYCRDVKEHKLQPDGTVMPCTDCRIQPVEEIVVANFAICRPPWVCPYIPESSLMPMLSPMLKLCHAFHQAWFGLRQTVETHVLQESKRVNPIGMFHQEIFRGYCLPGGSSGGSYEPMHSMIELPNGFDQQPFPARVEGSNS